MNALNTQEFKSIRMVTTINHFHDVRKFVTVILLHKNPYPKVPSKYMLRSSTRSMMPRIFDSRPMGMLTNAALWFSLVLK